MSERVRQTVALLRLRYEWVPGPVTSTGQLVASSGQRGEVRLPVECPRCKGEGELGGRGCGRCEGSGRVLADPMTVDERTAVAAVEGVRRSEVGRRRDREIARLQIEALHREGLTDPREREPWERAKAWLYANSSLAELDRCLLQLERSFPRERAAVEATFGTDAELRVISEPVLWLARKGAEWIAERMPDVIRVPESDVAARRLALSRAQGRAGVNGRWARDVEIASRYAGGVNVPSLAREYGLSERQIRRIVTETSPQELLRPVTVGTLRRGAG